MAIQFNDTSAAKNGLVQIGEEKLHGSNYGAISDSNKRLATFARNCNAGLNRYLNLAMQYETRWQFHDFNYTTHPEAYTSMTEGQGDYALSDLHLQIRNVYVVNSDGIKVPVKPVDEYDFSTHGVAIDDYYVQNGLPQFYDKRGASINLYPSPDANETQLTNGLFLTYTSAPSYFVYTDTTKAAGIPLNFQDFPAIYACWKLASGQDKIDYKAEVAEMENDIIMHLSQRDRDDKPSMKPRPKNYV